MKTYPYPYHKGIIREFTREPLEKPFIFVIKLFMTNFAKTKKRQQWRVNQNLADENANNI